MGRIIAALVAGIMLVASSGGALAQTDERQALGLQVAQVMFKALSLEDLIAKEAQGDTSDIFAEVKSRPEWKGYLVAALQEELRHDMPAIERMFGRAIAKDMSAEELRVGLALMNEPEIQAVFRAGAEGREPTGRPSRKVERMASTRAAQSFLEKLGTLDKTLDPLIEDVLIELMPGTMRRFADKAEAGEARRAAGQPAVK